MKTPFLIFFIVIAVLCGCTSPRQAAVKTLAAIGISTDAAYRSYLDLVVAGRVSTNGIPRVGAAYTSYQAIYNQAVVFVEHNTSLSLDSVTAASTKVITVITEEKAGAK
jgi:hypothetical protein